MNLFFGVDYGSSDESSSSINVASATLRLYRLPQNKTTPSTGEDCHRGKDSMTDEDDRQIRVSVYWYTRSLKKHKSKFSSPFFLFYKLFLEFIKYLLLQRQNVVFPIHGWYHSQEVKTTSR